ncbi:MAG: hypothetical protein ABSE73_16565 [Planctomycetota bacterium]
MPNCNDRVIGTANPPLMKSPPESQEQALLKASKRAPNPAPNLKPNSEEQNKALLQRAFER